MHRVIHSNRTREVSLVRCAHRSNNSRSYLRSTIDKQIVNDASHRCSTRDFTTTDRQVGWYELFPVSKPLRPRQLLSVDSSNKSSCPFIQLPSQTINLHQASKICQHLSRPYRTRRDNYQPNGPQPIQPFNVPNGFIKMKRTLFNTHIHTKWSILMH